MKRTAVLCLAAACFLGANPTARGDAIPSSEFSWGYHFEPAGHPIHLITNNNAVGIIGLPGHGGSNDMHTASKALVDISTKVWAFSTATANHPQTVSNLPFAINLKLTDHASGLSEYVSFSGTLKGNLWKNGSTLSPTFTSPLTEQVNIDHHLYTVAFEKFTPPAGLGHPGQFVFDVKVQHNPEPSSLVLAGIGMPLFGLILRRRRR
jgi:hypothetical protein